MATRAHTDTHTLTHTQYVSKMLAIILYVQYLTVKDMYFWLLRHGVVVELFTLITY